MDSQNKSQTLYMIRRGLTAGIPIILGYLPVAMTFGVLAKQSGMSMLELTLMSVFIYAGASQFMGVNMIAVGAGTIEIIIATFVLNFRHFVMSLSFMNRLREIGLSFRLPLSLLLTDETFAMASINIKEAEEKKGSWFYLTILFTAYLSWILGTILGGFLGEIIPDQLSQSMGIALYAMFIGLLVPSVKKELKVGLIAIIAMLINMICSQFMSDGWAIVLGTVIGGLSGVYFFKEDKS